MYTYTERLKSCRRAGHLYYTARRKIEMEIEIFFPQIETEITKRVLIRIKTDAIMTLAFIQ